MQQRRIIRIDEEKCTGCGRCIPDCPEGALQVIDGKARLVSDLFCDGLGACVGSCPEAALTVETRPAEPYDESRVMANIVKAGPNTIAAHLAHLKTHGATDYYEAALDYLRRHNIPLPDDRKPETADRRLPCGCPGSAVRTLSPPESAPGSDASSARPPSALRNWPIQLTLIPVAAPWLRNAELLIAADCVGAAHPAFHADLLRNRILIIACPKLDDADHYLKKLTEIFRHNTPKSVSVAHMTVPCCFGLVQLVRQAIAASGQTIPFAETTIGLDGSQVADN
uniref:4Fe-4S dicluster domain-containing protein n=1 Tax=candidate division WOR-3 bacterium TaxID=2052148 RepID=A0A7C4CBS0_UNCW3